MKITVQPEWSFFETLNEAWKAYPGGQQFGTPNRTRVLEQWANIVGKTRALKELNDILSEYPTKKKAAEELGFSTYTLRKLEKRFNAMPEIKGAYTKPKTLYQLLQYLNDLKKNDLSNHFIILQLIQDFTELLGYSLDEIHFNQSLPNNIRLRPDALIYSQDCKKPSIIIEAKNSIKNQHLLKSAIEQMRSYLSDSIINNGIIISPDHLILISRSKQTVFDLDLVDEEDTITIRKLINDFEVDQSPINTITKSNQSDQLDILIFKVINAKTNDEKKNSLEYLANFLFDKYDFINCKHQNLRTKTSEIDIVCEVSRQHNINLLHEMGRFFIIECKNWNKPVGAKEIRDFRVKIEDHHLRLGLFFSRNGITGERNGADGLGEIYDTFKTKDIFIILITLNDIGKIDGETEIFDLVDYKMDQIRFNF